MKKSIGMLLDGYYPSDIRVQKEAVALIQSGHRVALLCKRRKGELAVEQVDGVWVNRVKAGNSIAVQGIFDIIIASGLVHPVFSRFLPHFLKQHAIEVLHVHDLPLMKTAWQAVAGRHVRLIADFHENYPEALRVWFKWKTNPMIRLKNKLFFNYNRWQRYEKEAVDRADYVIAVVEEMRDRLISEHNLREDKVVVITNTESKAFVDQEPDEDIYGEDKEKFIVAYTGGVGPHRGVDTAIAAMNLLRDYPDIVLYITGQASTAARRAMEEDIRKYQLGDRVKVLGYQPFRKFYSFMKMATVNLIPHHCNGHTDNTVPHKLFQCMMTGRPLLVSSSKPLKRIVEETGSGLVFEAGNPGSLADRLVELYHNPDLRKKLGNNGCQATIAGNWNWEVTGKKLVNLYDTL